VALLGCLVLRSWAMLRSVVQYRPANAAPRWWESGAARKRLVVVRASSPPPKGASPQRKQLPAKYQKYAITGATEAAAGKSRYVRRLREDERRAESDPEQRHCLIIGERGLRKIDIAKLIHFGSLRRYERAGKVECGRLASHVSKNTIFVVSEEDCEGYQEKWIQHVLFGLPANSSPASFGKSDSGASADQMAQPLQTAQDSGLLHVLQGGTLILANVHLLSSCARSMLAMYVAAKVNIYGNPVGPSRPEDASKRVRLLMTSSTPLPEFDGLTKHLTVIKVPPLRLRALDIEAEAKYALRLASSRLGLSSETRPKEITPEAIRALQSYSFPGNLAELRGMMERAIIQVSGVLGSDIDEPGIVTEDVLWPSSSGSGTRFRWNLLRAFPRFKALLRSSFWPQGLMDYVVVPAFAITNLGLIFGPQDRDSNLFLNVFWCWWWPGILVTYPLVGRLWCAFCPFMAYGELVQKWRRAKGAALMKWPRKDLDTYGGWFLLALFAIILAWEELWDLPQHAILSSALLLLITFGAVVGSFFYEKRLWCRYLCPIGGMNGMFAKLAFTELRAKRGVCTASCTTYACLKGGPEDGEGMETDGCPLNSHPAQLVDNRNCVNCMTCLKACPHSSVEFNLRPPGIELWTTHAPAPHEVGLMFLLLGAVFTHRLPEIGAIFGVSEAYLHASLGDEGFGFHALSTAASLGYPGLIAFGTYTLGRFLPTSDRSEVSTRCEAPPNPRFVEEAYGYLPLTWLALLAHYLDMGMGEAGRVLPVTAQMLGLRGFAQSGLLPTLVADVHVIDFLQGLCLLLGAGLSLLLTRKLCRQPWNELWPECLAILLLTSQLWVLIV